MMESFIFLILAMILAPLYSAIILKVKAFFGGKQGPPLLINYFTLVKLLKRDLSTAPAPRLSSNWGPLFPWPPPQQP